MDSDQYKYEVEKRLTTNNNGSGYFDVFAVTWVLIPASLLAGLVGRAMSGNPQPSWYLRPFLEMVVLVLPMLVACTMETEELSFFISGGFTLGTLGVMRLVNCSRPGTPAGDDAATDKLLTKSSRKPLPMKTKTSNKRQKDEEDREEEEGMGNINEKDALLKPIRSCSSSQEHHALFFSRYRASLMLLTILSILAVDFPVYPARFMKTQMWGVSLMDSGVGCFVFSAAVAFGGKIAKTPKTTTTTTTTTTTLEQQKGRGSLLSITSSIPMIVLGFVRMAMVWGVDYHEVVTEYGQHWNFFFTLAVLPILFVCTQKTNQLLSTHLGGTLPWLHTLQRLPALQGVLCIGLYQVALSFFGLTEFIDSDYRGNLLAANKEGLASSFGYVAIYYAGIQYGKVLLSPRRSGSGGDSGIASSLITGGVGVRQVKEGVRVMLSSAVLWVLVAASETYVQPSSRRLCNVTYVLFIVALSSGFLGAFQCMDHLTPHNLTIGGAATPGMSSSHWRRSESLLDAINRNQLFLFLVANICTGIVNVSMRTILASTMTSYVVLFAYMGFLCGVALFLPPKAEVVLTKRVKMVIGI